MNLRPSGYEPDVKSYHFHKTYFNGNTKDRNYLYAKQAKLALHIILTSEEHDIFKSISQTKILEPIWNPRKQKAQRFSAKPLEIMVSPTGFEPVTH